MASLVRKTAPQCEAYSEWETCAAFRSNLERIEAVYTKRRAGGDAKEHHND